MNLIAYSEEKLLEFDSEDLSDTDALVILIVDSNPVMKTRLQKLSLLYDRLYNKTCSITDHNAYFFGGYSDDIEESAVNLVDSGILKEDRQGYSLTDYGLKLKKFIKDEKTLDSELKNIDNLKFALSEVPDRNVIGLTYHFYEDTAINSTIKNSVERLNNSSRLNDAPMSSMSKEEFENYLRNGKKIVITQ